MRKAFTLIEIIITLLLIAIILAMVTSLGSGFSDRVRFANTKEEVIAKVTTVIQEAATTNAVRMGSGWQRYGMLNLMVAQSGNMIQRIYSSGELTLPVMRESKLSYGSLETSGFNLQMRPYAVGCEVISGGTFTVISADNLNLKACYQTDSNTCKVREVPCGQ